MVLEEAGDRRRFFVGVWPQLEFVRLAGGVVGSSEADVGGVDGIGGDR
jgi:hypothetical protein